MQKARVITRSLEGAGHLADQLRSYGYAVEIVAPDQLNQSDADIEIEMEFCTVAEALDRAAELAQADDSDVYVAAGCFREEKLPAPAEVVVASRLSAVDTVNGVAAGLQNKRDLLAKALREQRALMREARISQRQRREQEAARQAVQQAERARLAKQAEVARVTEEQKRIALQQYEEAAQRRIAQAEKAELARSIRRVERESPYVPPPPRRTREWRLAFVIAAIFAAVLTLGWSAATRAPVSPLPPGMVNGHSSLEEQTPFGAATIRPPIAKPASTLLPAASLPVSKPSAMPQVVQRTSPKHSKSGHFRREHQSTRTDDARTAVDVADDEVRHVLPSQPVPTQPHSASPPHASLKRYSDLQ